MLLKRRKHLCRHLGSFETRLCCLRLESQPLTLNPCGQLVHSALHAAIAAVVAAQVVARVPWDPVNVLIASNLFRRDALG